MGWVRDDPILHYNSRQGSVCAHTACFPPCRRVWIHSSEGWSNVVEVAQSPRVSYGPHHHSNMSCITCKAEEEITKGILVINVGVLLTLHVLAPFCEYLGGKYILCKAFHDVACAEQSLLGFFSESDGD